MVTRGTAAGRGALLVMMIGLWAVLTSGRGTAGVNQWTSHGLEGGFVFTLAIDPHTPTTLYAGVVVSR